MIVPIQATIRDVRGTSASRSLRRENKIPAILYGDNINPISIVVNHKDVFYELQKEKFHTSILSLYVDDKQYNVIVRDFQMHPFKQLVQHIDFQIVSDDKQVKIKVPLHLINEEISPTVKLHGNRISQLSSTIEILAFPKNIPDYLELDLINMVSGQIYHISDIKFPKGVESIALKKGKNPTIVNSTSKK